MSQALRKHLTASNKELKRTQLQTDVIFYYVFNYASIKFATRERLGAVLQSRFAISLPSKLTLPQGENIMQTIKVFCIQLCSLHG